MRKARKLAKVLFNREYRRALFRAGVAAAIEHERTLGRLDCRTVIDIGANRGQFALTARHCFPAARIYSFEPLPVPAAKYRQIFSHDPLVKLHELAIGDESGDATIHISAADDSSSLLPITPLQSELFSGTEEVGTATIHVARLEDAISRDEVLAPAMLKIDVQGYELTTLKGCVCLLDVFEFVYVECSFIELYQGQAMVDEVYDFLRHHGWSLEGIYGMRYETDGRAIQADFLFKRS